ncbi:MAG TPA: hypothetical protein H9898_08260, partial [Candidatus Anaerobiospirillum stercoravium]|nr:hypothetical protein [Candidatus Anaerobiospirillum stercoravium]
KLDGTTYVHSATEQAGVPRVFTRSAQNQVAITTQRPQTGEPHGPDAMAAAAEVLRLSQVPHWAVQDLKAQQAELQAEQQPASAPQEGANTMFAPNQQLSDQEQESLRQAAQDAVLAGIAPTEAEQRLGDQYQALQHQDGLTEAIVAKNEHDPYRSRDHGPSALSSKQAATLIAQQRHMMPHGKAIAAYEHAQYAAHLSSEQRRIKAADEAFIDEIMRKNQPSADTQSQKTDFSAEPVKSDDEEPQGGLGPNFQRAQRQALLDTDPAARRRNPALAFLSPTSARPAALDAAAQAAPHAAAPEAQHTPLNGAPQTDTNAGNSAALDVATQAAPHAADPVTLPTPLNGAPQTDTNAGNSATLDAVVQVAPHAAEPVAHAAPLHSTEQATSRTDESAILAADTQSASHAAEPADSDYWGVEEAPAPMTHDAMSSDDLLSDVSSFVSTVAQAAAQLPADFVQQAQTLRACKKLLAPVLNALRAQEDTVLGARFAPKREDSNSFYQLEEDIYGTGFHSGEQATHLMLEFLMVLACQNQDEPFALTQSDPYGTFAYFKRRSLRLRQILFNNPMLGDIATSTQSDESKWKQWFAEFCANNNWHKTTPASRAAKGTDASLEDAALSRAPDNSERSEELQLAEQFGQLQAISGFGYGESFERFVSLVKVLRSWSIDTDKDRQWSTLFLFPFGYEALFWEITNDGTFKQNLFAGAGQNVFSMLARARATCTQPAASSTVPDLGARLVRRFFVDHNGLNLGAGYLGGSLLAQQAPQDPRLAELLEVREQQMLRTLQHEATFAQRIAHNSQADNITISATRYLPYRDLPRYHLLLEEFEAISRLDLTKQELFLALGALGILHQLCYLLEQEAAVLRLPLVLPDPDARTRAPDLNLVAVINPEHKNAVRALSMRRLKENLALFETARAHYIRAHLQALVAACAPELLTKESLSPAEQTLVGNLMRSAFDFKQSVHLDLAERTIGDEPGEVAVVTTTESICYSEIEDLMVNHKRDVHMQALHSTWCANIGLSTKESAVTYYYCLSDELLYYLVLALVPPGRPLPLKVFLTKLHERYHLVVGPHEAQQSRYGEEDDFNANERQLKLKLQRNHLLISLSDSFDYVRNPFS